MALTKCPDCGKEISDVAPSCLGCGRPMAGAPSSGSGVSPLPTAPKVQTVEQTGKNWKAAQLLGGMSMFAGCASCMGSFGNDVGP